MQLLWVCVGGAIGSGCRHLVGVWTTDTFGTGFPYGTLIVNTLGSFLISVVMSLSMESGAISPLMRLFLVTGVMGGFTTYSSFNYETIKLYQSGAYLAAGGNALATLLVCAMAGFLGLFVGSRMASWL